MTGLELLTPLSLFEGISTERLEPLAHIAQEVYYQKDAALFKEGGMARRLFVLLKGKVVIQVSLSSRPESITVASLAQSGQLVGWSGSVQPNNYTAAATCMEDCHLLAFDGQEFMTVLENDPEMGFIVMRRITEVISERLRNIQRVVLKTL